MKNICGRERLEEPGGQGCPENAALSP